MVSFIHNLIFFKRCYVISSYLSLDNTCIYLDLNNRRKIYLYVQFRRSTIINEVKENSSESNPLQLAAETFGNKSIFSIYNLSVFECFTITILLIDIILY
jgi:hypothetical protein